MGIYSLSGTFDFHSIFWLRMERATAQAGYVSRVYLPYVSRKRMDFSLYFTDVDFLFWIFFLPFYRISKSPPLGQNLVLRMPPFSCSMERTRVIRKEKLDSPDSYTLSHPISFLAAIGVY